MSNRTVYGGLMRNLFILLCFPLIQLLWSAGALAQLPDGNNDIFILDNSDITRASAKIEDSAYIMFILNDTQGRLADGVSVTLTDSVTGERITRTTSEGRVVFCDIPGGSWRVTSNVDWVIFQDIEIENATNAAMLAADCSMLGTYLAAGSSAVGAVAGLAAVGGATTIAVAGYNRYQSDKDTSRTPLSPSR